MARPLEIAVCGCGPAGLAAGLLLGRAGQRVHLLERFDEPRPLGSGLILQPPGLAVLAALGLAPEILALGRRLRRLAGRALPSGRTVLEVDYGALGPGSFGLGVHRAALFGVLHRAAGRAGLDIVTGCEVTGWEPAAGGRGVVLDGRGRRLGPFDLIVDALGSRSPLAAGALGHDPHRPLPYGALWASLPWPGGAFAGDVLEQRYRGARVMIGVLPTGRRQAGAGEEAALFWSLKPATYAGWRQRGLAAWRDEVAALWPETEPLLAAVHDEDQLVLARYSHHTLPLPAAGCLAAIGDAAHATSPQLGQGANMALLDAWALARALAEAGEAGPALARYAQSRRWHVRLYQALSATFTPFYQSDSRLLPALRDRLFAGTAGLPGAPRLLASLVAGLWGEPLRRLGLSAFDPRESRQPAGEPL